MASTDRYRTEHLRHSPLMYPSVSTTHSPPWSPIPEFGTFERVPRRFEDDWRYAQETSFQDDNMRIGHPAGYPGRYSMTDLPPEIPSNVPFYVPKSSPNIVQYDYPQRMTSPSDAPPHRSPPFSQMNYQVPSQELQAPRAIYSPRRVDEESDRRERLFSQQPPSREPIPPPRPSPSQPQYRHSSLPRQRPDSRTRRHNPYPSSDSRRIRKSTGSQSQNAQKRRAFNPSHHNRQNSFRQSAR